MTFKITSLILMTFILISCGEKKASSVVKLKIFKGNQLSNGASFDGGILLMGRSEDGKNSFRTGVIGTDNVDLDLAKGRWEFAAISWQGSAGIMTGDNRCSYTGFVDLKDDQASVSFDLVMSNCKNTFNGRDFADSDYIKADGRFFNFQPRMCLSESPEAIRCDNTNSSTIHSYKLLYKGDMKGLVSGKVDPLLSECFIINGTNKASLPVTDNAYDNPLKPNIRFYKNSTCDGIPDIVYSFDQSILDTILPDWEFIVNSTPNTLFYVNPGPKFDAEPANPSGLTLTGVNISGIQTFATTTISFSVSPPPPVSATMFCLTLNANCTDQEWKPINLYGSTSISAGVPDGPYLAKLYFKTAADIESSTPSTANIGIDRTSPTNFTIPNVVDNTGYINVIWTGSDNSSFEKWIVEICADAACGSVLITRDIATFGNQNKILTDSTDLITLVNGTTYYVRIKSKDVFGRVSNSGSKNFIFTNAP